jgi:hypothetical protein
MRNQPDQKSIYQDALSNSVRFFRRLLSLGL